MKRILLLFAIYLFLTGSVSAQTNAGFVSGVWYSKRPFFDGETIRIYSAVQNQSGFDITGTIKFFDNGEIIGESDFSAINGRLVEKWIDWKVSEGKHKIQAKIFNPKKSIPGGGEEPITLAASTSEVSEEFADFDTDSDGVGNREDEDDDGDGLSDAEEIKIGSNPLVANTKEDTPPASASKEAEAGANRTKQGREIAEQFVVEPAKKALAESKPIIERVGELLQTKQNEVEKRIEKDKDNRANLAAVSGAGFYEKLREKLPPTFRILYNWLLKFLILVFSVWWIPLIIFILIVLKILLGLYRRIKYR